MKHQPNLDGTYNAAQPIVDSLLIAMTHAQIEREKCDAIQRKILSGCAYFDQHSGKRVLDPKLAYHMNDQMSLTFFAALDAAYKEAGYTVPEGYCPALMAGHKVIQLENELIAKVGPTVGIKPEIYSMDHRKKFIDLTINMVLANPQHKSPMAKEAA